MKCQETLILYLRELATGLPAVFQPCSYTLPEIFWNMKSRKWVLGTSIKFHFNTWVMNDEYATMLVRSNWPDKWWHNEGYNKNPAPCKDGLINYYACNDQTDNLMKF